LENSKTDLAYLHKTKKHLTKDKEELEQELETLKKTFQIKEERIMDLDG